MQKKITKTTVLNEIIADKKIKLHKEIGPLKKIQTGIKLKMKYSGSQIKKQKKVSRTNYIKWKRTHHILKTR